LRSVIAPIILTLVPLINHKNQLKLRVLKTSHQSMLQR